LYLEEIDCLLDAKVHYSHVQVIRRDIKPRSAERSRDVENEMISEKIVRIYPWVSHFKTPFTSLAYFLRL
jgi:hypothetical protein